MKPAEIQAPANKASFLSRGIITLCILLSGCAAFFWLAVGIITRHYGMIVFSILFVLLTLKLVSRFRAVDASNQLKLTFRSVISVPIVCAVIFCLLKSPSGFRSDLPRAYRFDKQFAELKHGNSSVKWFPQKLPEQISDYHLSYLPSLMQGTGHFTVRFTCSPEEAENIAETYAAKAIYTFPLQELHHGMTYQVEAFSPKATVTYDNDHSLDIYWDYDFFGTDNPDAVVYVTAAVHNWNHPHSSAVIVDSKKGAVEFSQFG